MSLLSLATYTAEIYPTHLRAVGGGIASAWQRGASMVGTYVVGLILPVWGINAVFAMFGCFALMGALVAFFFAVETRGQVLEFVSPASGSAEALPLAPSDVPSRAGTSSSGRAAGA
jgi:MFS transporter, putative metabolite:H+ symporter